MTEAPKLRRTAGEIADWLAARHDGVIADLHPLGGGFWSSAYAYRVGAQEFVLRLSDLSEGFAIDAAAMRFRKPELPIPEVLETGDALGLHFAISRRHRGRFVEAATEREAGAVGGALEALLTAMRAVPAASSDPVLWYDPATSAGLTWRSWLLAGLVDDPKARVSGWRAKLAVDRRLDALFRACEGRVRELLPLCPEGRNLVHGDLLHQNVLIADDAARVTAIFSWKCSVRGDFLFDVAWCTLWSAWYPGIAAADLWRRTLADAHLGASDLADAPSRHHCYELQIAASHLGWYAWNGDHRNLDLLADVAERTLERGPLAAAP